MDITVTPGKLHGEITAIPSKSQAHRLLICAAFADCATFLHCPDTNRDIEATADCLRSLGAKISRTSDGYHVEPVHSVPENPHLYCHDSGSTLRFMLPIVGALGADAIFHLEGRLPQRPLSPMWEEMERMGCRLTRPTSDTICCCGKLQPGAYSIDGSVSSQFITGFLLSFALMDGESTLSITGRMESVPYISMTCKAMALFGKDPVHYRVRGGRFHSPGELTVEGDWSNGAFFLAANSLGSQLDVRNLSPDSPQGDRAAAAILEQLEQNITISARDIPDLVPILAVTAAAKQGASFTDIRRLRLKESDRVATVTEMIRSLGGKAESTEDTLYIYGTGLTGGTVDTHNDHRIAMAAAIAATVCTQPVAILGAECADKSYPQFFDEYRRLGGNYEQHLR